MPIIIPYVVYVYIHDVCPKYSVDEALFIGTGLTEKGKYEWTDAVIGDINNGWSFSPMQLNLNGAGTGRNPNDLVKPEVWTGLAAQTIRSNLDAFPGDLEAAISAYNQGQQGVRNNGKEFNRAYINAVLVNYNRVKTEGIRVVGSGDHDGQTFIPSSGKWEGFGTSHAPNTGAISEAYLNVLGVANSHSHFLLSVENTLTNIQATIASLHQAVKEHAR